MLEDCALIVETRDMESKANDGNEYLEKAFILDAPDSTVFR